MSIEFDEVSDVYGEKDDGSRTGSSCKLDKMELVAKLVTSPSRSPNRKLKEATDKVTDRRRDMKTHLSVGW